MIGQIEMKSREWARETLKEKALEPLANLHFGMSLKEIERQVILATLERQRFNRTKTARMLGIGIRTLQRKLKSYREIDLAI